MSDEAGKVGNLTMSRDGEAVAEVIPEGDAELGAGLGQAEESIAAVAPDVASGAAADLTPGDLTADVVLGAVGVQWDLRVVEHQQQFGLFGVEAREQPIEAGKAGMPLEDTIEAGAQLGAPARRGVGFVSLEIAVKPPDERAHALLRRVLPLAKGVELVDQALGMHPAQAMPPEIELSGVIADNSCRGQETMRPDAAPQSALGGDTDRVVTARQRGNAEPVEMRLPAQAIGEAGLGMTAKPSDRRLGEMVPAHVGERLGIDRVIVVPRAQQFEEVAPALRTGSSEPGEMRVADLGAEAVPRLVAHRGIVDCDPGGARQPSPQHLARLAEKALLPADQQPHHLTLRDRQAEAAQLLDQPRHRHLSLVVLRQDKAPQLGAEMAGGPGRQRRHHGAPIGGQPALAAVADGARPDLQILDDIDLVALEARTGR